MRRSRMLWSEHHRATTARWPPVNFTERFWQFHGSELVGVQCSLYELYQPSDSSSVSSAGVLSTFVLVLGVQQMSARCGKSIVHSCLEFQVFQQFQQFQEFQELGTHFKRVSRDSKSYQAFQEFQEHVSRGSNWFKIIRVDFEILKFRPARKVMTAPISFQAFQAFQEFQEFQELGTHFKRVSRDSKSYQAFQEFQEHVSRVIKHDLCLPHLAERVVEHFSHIGQTSLSSGGIQFFCLSECTCT